MQYWISSASSLKKKVHENARNVFHADTLQSLLLLLNAGFLVEKQQISISQSSVWQDRGLNPMIYHNGVKHFNYYTNDLVSVTVQEDSQ